MAAEAPENSVKEQENDEPTPEMTCPPPRRQGRPDLHQAPPSPLWREALHQRRHGLGVTQRRHDRLGAPIRLEPCCCVDLVRVDVVVCAQRQSVLLDVLASPNGDDLDAHAPRILYGHVPEAANTKDRDRIARLCARLLQCVEGGDACAKDGRCLFGTQGIGDGHQAGGPSQHHLG